VQLFASGGTFELVAVHFDDHDLAAAGETIAALGLALLPPGDDDAASVLSDFTDDREQPSDLVASFARSHGLLDLAATPTRRRSQTSSLAASNRPSSPSTGNRHTSGSPSGC